MMKKLLSLLLTLATTFIQAQYTVSGTMTPPEKSDWVALYKIGGAKQKFIANKTIEMSSVDVGGTKQKIGNFEFILPETTEVGAYRILYRDQGAGFVDFYFNKEDIEMIFNPQFPSESIVFTKSLENKVYMEYLDAQNLSQRKLVTLQEKYLKSKEKAIKKAYKKEVSRLKDSQKIYEKKSKSMLVNAFIKSSKVDYPSSPLENIDQFRNYEIENFFNNVDFENKKLYNSAFYINKIADYIFYLNVADNQELQQKMYKESIKKVMTNAKSNHLKKSFSEYLISTFVDKRNSGIVDWMFDSYYDNLPESFKTVNFKKKKLNAIRVSVGRTAPDFSWKEDKKTKKLSTLIDGEKYLLIFWSTQCSHCVEEIPEIYKFTQKKKDLSVIAFAIEENDLDFNSWAKNKLVNWHNVLGTNPGGNKYENKTVQDYLIDATPTYFILDKNKKIIAIPNNAKDVKDYLNKK